MSPSHSPSQKTAEPSEAQFPGAKRGKGTQRPKGPEASGASVAISAMSRTFAALGILFLLAFLGSLIDRWLSTSVFLPIFGIVGSILAVIGMLYTVKVAEIEARRLREAQREMSPPEHGSDSTDPPSS